MDRTKWPATYTWYLALTMQLSPALQSLFSFHLGCGYAGKKKMTSGRSRGCMEGPMEPLFWRAAFKTTMCKCIMYTMLTLELRTSASVSSIWRMHGLCAHTMSEASKRKGCHSCLLPLQIGMAICYQMRVLIFLRIMWITSCSAALAARNGVRPLIRPRASNTKINFSSRSSIFCNFTPRIHQKWPQKVRNPKFFLESISLQSPPPLPPAGVLSALYLNPPFHNSRSATADQAPPSHLLTNIIINAPLDANVDRKLGKSPSIWTVNNWRFPKVAIC